LEHFSDEDLREQMAFRPIADAFAERGYEIQTAEYPNIARNRIMVLAGRRDSLGTSKKEVVTIFLDLVLPVMRR
jgi:hypothetical protein